MNSNRTLVANFTLQQFTITALVDPSQWAGGVEGGGVYTYGQSCTLTATPTVPYIFVNWTKNGIQVSTNITALANPTEGGVVTGSGTYEMLDECTVTATANEGYNFVNWTENGNVVSNEAAYTFAVTGDRTLVANFELMTFEITASADPIEAASISGAGTYNYGEEVTLTFDRNEDWAFQNWTENGDVVSEEMTYTFIATENRNLVANFLFTEGIGENSIAAHIYPNPTKGEFTLEGEGLSHIRIVNAYGQTVYNANLEGDQVRIDLSQMGKGIYMMHIETEGGHAVRKIVVE